MPSHISPHVDHRHSNHRYATVAVPSRVESIRRASHFIVGAARRMEVPAATDTLFEVAIVEALNNAFKHGNAGRTDAKIVCEVMRAGRQLTVRIHDQGPGFTLQRVPEPVLPTEVALLPESGFGFGIIQKVFPVVRTVGKPGDFALEMALTF